MPDLGEPDTLFIQEPGISSPSGPVPANPQRTQRAPAKPREGKLPHFSPAPVTDHELNYPQAIIYNSKNKASIQIRGVIGDLDEHGLDLFAGYIARINGIGFTELPCDVRRNPGGFGLTYRPPRDISPVAMVPESSDPLFRPWMESMAKMDPDAFADIKFESYKEGGEALRLYLDLIRTARIPYYPFGPLTPLSDILIRYECPCYAETTVAWSDILKVLNQAGLA